MSQSQKRELHGPTPGPALQRWLKTPVWPVATWPVQHREEDRVEERAEPVALEEPFEVRLNGRSLAVIMRTPGATLESDRELALGFLLSEGLIEGPEQVEAIGTVKDSDGLPAENILNVQTSSVAESETENSEPHFERRFVVASSCGLCGKNSILEVSRRLPPLDPSSGEFKVPAKVLYSLPALLRAGQAVFDQTGGLHAAGLFDRQGQLLLLREDVGRHNAVDKVLGRRALDRVFPLSDCILMVSGRCSFEIVQKALAARIPVVAAVSAPSSLALELAQESGLTLVGFLRNHTMNVYTHYGRIEE